MRCGERTRHGVLDIDETSKYHSAAELLELAGKLAAVGLTPTPYQSSDSGGWHVYLFLDDWEESRDVQETLRAWLTAQGYEIRGGTLELFPSGNGLRLPLQAGFAWLDDNGNLVDRRENLTTEQAIARFMSDLAARASNWAESKRLIESQLHAAAAAAGGDAQGRQERLNCEGFEPLFNYRLIPENYQRGREYWQTGLTASGQRHEAILCVEHYLWHGDVSAGVPALPGDWNDEGRYRLIRAWIEAKHNGYCNHINRGNWRKVEAQIRRAVKWRRASGVVQARTPYPLTERLIERLIALSRGTRRTWTVEDLRKGNDGREAEAREKIREAVQLLTAQGRRVTVRQLMRLTGCSYHTVKRHLDIWKISPMVALPRAAGDKNSFLGDLDLFGGGCPGPVVLEKKIYNSALVQADSRDLGCVQEDNAEVPPPLLSCLAGEPTTCTQHQDQALRVASEVLTPGPVLRGIQAVLQEGAGGGFFDVAAGTGKLCLFVSGSVGLWNAKQTEGSSSPPGKLADAVTGPAADVITVYTDSVSNYGFICTTQLPLNVAGIRCTRLQSVPFWLFVYGDVRGPPKCIRLT